MKTFTEFEKLKERVNNSYKSLEGRREKRLEAIKTCAGSSYVEASGDIGSDTLVNLLQLLVNGYMQELISGDPRFLVHTTRFQYKTSAHYFQMALNHALKKIDFRSSLALCVLESLFSIGVMKIGVTSQFDELAAGYLHEPFLPFADPIFFDDLVFDTRVSTLEQCEHIGNHYRLHREDVENDPRNDATAVKEIGEGGTQWDLMSGERAEELSGAHEGFNSSDDRDFYDLWDIWLPRKGLMVTYAENGGQRPLRELEWEGPTNGPYPTLSFNSVLANIMPVAPCANALELAILFNELWVKMGEQASRQKTITFCDASHIADGRRVVHANDGETISVRNPGAVSQARFGGVEQTTMQMQAAVREINSYVNGNMDSRAGLSIGAPTLGQEELMANSASGVIRSMQLKLSAFVERVGTDIGWHLWNDPMVDLHLMGKVQGTDIEYETQWPKQEDELGREFDLRKGQYNDLNLQLEPFSMRDQAPQTRLATIRGILQLDIVPLMPLIQQQGGRFNVGAYLKIVGEYANEPGLADIIEMGPAPDPMEESPTEQMGAKKPAATSRTYERVRGGGPSSGGANRALMAGMGSGSNGGSEVMR